MRTVVKHMAGAIAFGTLMALLVPAAPQSLSHYSVVAASAAANAGVVTKPAATAATDGRWKLGGDGSCYFDPDDSGPDQCTAAPGRWKLGGDGSCYFDANDSGPNQCTPSAADGTGTDSTASVSAQPRTADFYSRL